MFGMFTPPGNYPIHKNFSFAAVCIPVSVYRIGTIAERIKNAAGKRAEIPISPGINYPDSLRDFIAGYRRRRNFRRGC